MKMIETSQVAREIMFSKQSNVEYRDRPNTLLAKLLAGNQERVSMPLPSVTKDGKVVEASGLCQIIMRNYIKVLNPPWKRLIDF